MSKNEFVMEPEKMIAEGFEVFPDAEPLPDSMLAAAQTASADNATAECAAEATEPERVPIESEALPAEAEEEGKDSFKFEIVNYFGSLSPERSDGFALELNLVSFNDYPAKFDLRAWNHPHNRMKKGITLTKAEALKLRDILNGIDFSKFKEPKSEGKQKRTGGK